MAKLSKHRRSANFGLDHDLGYMSLTDRRKIASSCYSDAMKLMQHDGDKRNVRDALDLFIMGAKLQDRYCKERLKEIAKTSQYIAMIDDDRFWALYNALRAIRKEEDAEAELSKLRMMRRKGIFGGMRHRPINKMAAGGISG